MIVRREPSRVLLTTDEVATAIDAYLAAHRINITGPRTVLIVVSGEELPCQPVVIIVDQSGQLADNR